MQRSVDIAVLGAGPAGAVAALGLARLGCRVAVLGRPRGYAAAEGLSDRVIEGLGRAGCRHALAAIGPEAVRRASWNGASTAANREHLVERAVFDAALLDDLQEADIAPPAARVDRVAMARGRVRIEARAGGGRRLTIDAGFVVEARGRAAPAGRRRRIAGPPTTALIQRWSGPPGPAATALASFAEGWAWTAAFEDGTRYVQIAEASGPGRLPKRSELASFFRRRLDEVAEAQGWLAGTEPAGPVAARNATATMNRAPVEDRLIRVGDAALAVDPLSGHGVFQALSGALAAPAVINTLLTRPADAALARRFHADRVAAAFDRFARIGREFYAAERRWPGHAFWRERRGWPDDAPAHGPIRGGRVELARRPVIEDGFVVAREVVLTDDHPLGIWRLAGIELAPVLRALAAAPPKEDLAARIAGQTGAAPDAARIVADWLVHRGLVAGR